MPEPDEKDGDPKGDPDPKPAPATPAPDVKTFDQADMDALAGKIRAEERAKQPTDYDEMKTKLKTLEDANLTDAEKQQREIATLQRTASDADERIATIAITSEIKVEAAQMGLVDPEAAVLLLDRSAVSYTEEGGVVGVKEALATLVEQRAYLKGQGAPAPKPDLDAGGLPGAAAPPLTEDQRETAALLFPSLPAAEGQAEYAKGLNP